MRESGAGAQRSSRFILYRVVSDSFAAAAVVAAEAARERAEVAKCECCGLGEECTAGYVHTMRQQFCGRFVCGLCAEAVKEEQARTGSSVETALEAHMKVCKQFNVAVRGNPVAAANSAMRELLVRRTKSGLQLSRSTSCIPALATSSL